MLCFTMYFKYVKAYRSFFQHDSLRFQNLLASHILNSGPQLFARDAFHGKEIKYLAR